MMTHSDSLNRTHSLKIDFLKYKIAGGRHFEQELISRRDSARELFYDDIVQSYMQKPTPTPTEPTS